VQCAKHLRIADVVQLDYCQIGKTGSRSRVAYTGLAEHGKKGMDRTFRALNQNQNQKWFNGEATNVHPT